MDTEKGNNNLPNGTTDNRYCDKKVQYTDNDIQASNISTDNSYMHAYGSYTTQTVARLLGKAAVTINKAARENNIGYLRGNLRLYLPKDVSSLKDIFMARRQPKRRPGRNDVTIFYEWFQDFDRFRSECKKRFTHIERRLWELEKKRVDEGGNESIGSVK